LTEEIERNLKSVQKTYPLSVIIALICSGTSALIMAFLIVFGFLQSCSVANIAIFIVLLGVSALLVFLGIIIGAFSYIKLKIA
jgi:hypothetical protein